MTEPQVRSSGVELLAARRLHLVKAAAPWVSLEHQLAMDRVGDEAGGVHAHQPPQIGLQRVESVGRDLLG
ncbi:MAG: hypothetical protein ACRDTC_17925 [Pseudonocardiaceae bacterium]